MATMQDMFAKIQATKKEMKVIKKAYRDALLNQSEYQDVTDQMKKLREQKKRIENETKDTFAKEFDKLNDLGVDLLAAEEKLSDMTLTAIAKGETVMVRDDYANSYEPKVKVTFKRAG